MDYRVGYIHPYFEYFTRHEVTAIDVCPGDYFSMFDKIYRVSDAGTTKTNNVVHLSVDEIDQNTDQVKETSVPSFPMFFYRDFWLTVYRNPAEVHA